MSREVLVRIGAAVISGTAFTTGILMDVVWWKLLLLSIGWGASMFLGLRELREVLRRDRQTLDMWNRVGGDLLLVLDWDTQVIKTVGTGFARTLGWSAHELIGTPWTTFVHPDDMQAALVETEHLQIDGYMTHNFISRWRHKHVGENGEQRWVWFEWQALGSKRLHLIYANARDMTSRFEREAQMATWSQITTDLMAVADMALPVEERRFDWLNDAWCRSLGWTAQELYQMRVIDLLSPIESANVIANRQARERAGDKAMQVSECLVRCKTPPGAQPKFKNYEWVSVSLNGKLYTSGRDIDQEIQHREELQRVIRDLEARNTDLERFASVTAHQLRSPPRTIAGIAQALQEDYGHLLGEEGLQFLQDIRTDADQMAEIVDGLHRFSKVRTSADMNLEPVDLCQLLTEVKGSFLRGFSDRDVECSKLPVVLGDKVLLAEVFRNLLDNGFKFNTSDKKLIRVTAEHREDGRWNISVSDNGIGMDPKYHHKVFQMFQRVHPQYKGTGVGLALVAAIINKMGGTIGVKSDVGQGTTFTFDLEPGWAS